MNGELDSQADGFRKITIRHKTDQHIEIDASGITVRGHNETTYTAQGVITAGRCCSPHCIFDSFDSDKTAETVHIVMKLDLQF